MSQWAMYFLPSIVAFIRLRMGKKIHLSLGFLILLNLLVAWTVIGWILMMADALGYDPILWVISKLIRFWPGGGVAPMNAAQAAWGPSSPGQICG